MSSKINVLQVIPKLGYGGAETGCYDIAHYLSENKCKSYIVTSGGDLIKFIDKKKVKLIRLPVHSKNPLLIFLNALILIGIILIFKISIVHARSRAPAWSCLLASKITGRKVTVKQPSATGSNALDGTSISWNFTVAGADGAVQVEEAGDDDTKVGSDDTDFTEDA